MRLDVLLEGVQGARVEGNGAVEIGGIACDSRQVGPGSLFVALRGGEEEDRHPYVPDAVRRGAAAVLVEDAIDAEVPVARVPQVRSALSMLAARFYDKPGEVLKLVGITGTNGKTTTACLVHSVLEAGGLPSGYIGTLGRVVSGAMEKGANTTPEAHHLQRDLRAMVDAGRHAAVLEVSSHALALGRVGGLEFSVAAFTNLSRDHLDFHRNEEAYFAAKAALFQQVAGGGRGVFNIDDDAGRRLWGEHRNRGLSYGFDDGADIRPREWSAGRDGVRLNLVLPGGEMAVNSRLTGRFNCHNVMAAVACGWALGLDPEAIRSGVEVVENVPGRFERVAPEAEIEVIVDYAHTPDALENALRAARPLAAGRLVCLFGCGGDRDKGKRAQMGAVASRLADRVILTSDNPRTEDPEAILDDIAVGMGERGAYARLVDRREAIAAAIEGATAGDVVLLAGKGHETEQIFAGGAVRFDDREEAARVLQGLGKASAAGGGRD